MWNYTRLSSSGTWPGRIPGDDCPAKRSGRMNIWAVLRNDTTVSLSVLSSKGTHHVRI